MCLNISVESLEDTNKLKAEDKPIVAYKILDPNMKSHFYANQWQFGENISNRESIELTEEEISMQEVYYGLHFFPEEPRICPDSDVHKCGKEGRLQCRQAYRYPYLSKYACPIGLNKVLKAEIQPEDLVATGHWGQTPSIVATKCKITEEI